MTRLGGAVSQLSLRTRLTALSTLGAVLVLPVVVLALRGAVVDSIEDAVTAELRVRAGDVAAEVANGIEPVVADGLVTQLLDDSGQVRIPRGGTPLLGVDDLPDQPGEEAVHDRPVPSVGDRARVLARALPGDEGWVLVAGSTAPIHRVERRLTLIVGVAGPVLVLLLAATAWMLTRSALQPVQRMTRRASTLSLQHPDERLPLPPGRDEIAELGHTLNSMLDRIESTVAHERAFVDDASHELRTPIAVLRGELELALLELRDAGGGTVRSIESALEETDRLARITERLLVLARADAGRLADAQERIALMPAVARVVDRVDAGSVQLEVTGVEASVLADPDLVDQLLTNLVANAVSFARRVVRVTVESSDDGVHLRVDDDGPGFDPEILDRAFDRFARADPSRTRQAGGTGLGLAIVAAIVEALDGRITLANDGPLGGASVDVRLPRAPRGS
jgi:signal transduction histidine kinase